MLAYRQGCMANPTIGQLLTLYDIANTAANFGESVPLDEAKDAMADQRTTDLIGQYDDLARLELYEDEIIAKMDDVIAHKHVYDENDLGVQDNGLRLIAKNVLHLIQHEEFRSPETDAYIEPSSLEVVQDWR